MLKKIFKATEREGGGKRKINFIYGNFFDYKFTTKFDLILVFGSLYLNNKKNFSILKKLYKNLNKKGAIVLSAQNMFFDFVKFNLISREFYKYLLNFTEKQIAHTPIKFFTKKPDKSTFSSLYKKKYNDLHKVNPLTFKNLIKKKFPEIKKVELEFYNYNSDPIFNKKKKKN